MGKKFGKRQQNIEKKHNLLSFTTFRPSDSQEVPRPLDGRVRKPKICLAPSTGPRSLQTDPILIERLLKEREALLKELEVAKLLMGSIHHRLDGIEAANDLAQRLQALGLTFDGQ